MKTAQRLETLKSDTLQAGRQWLADSMLFRNAEPEDILNKELVSDFQVVYAVESHYPDGWKGFIQDRQDRQEQTDEAYYLAIEEVLP